VIMAKRVTVGTFRISVIRSHPWTKQPMVVISRWYGSRWQLVQSYFHASVTTVDDPKLQRFLTWARERYPQAMVREV